MIPLRDNIPSRTTPFVNYTLIAVTGIIFLIQIQDSDRGATLVERLGMVPLRLSEPGKPITIEEMGVVRGPFGLEQVVFERELAPPAVPVWLTPLTCIFLHGGWMHFIGNMWFLWIFGDNVEDRFGHVGYLLFYLGTGVAASLAHYATAPASPIPTIGASGAIAGVMGAYLWLYPHAKVVSLFPIIIIFTVVVLPAPLFLGIWFLMQLFEGTFALHAVQSTGVAWWAHIGGFLAGFLVAWLLGRQHLLSPKVEVIRPGTDDLGFRRYRR